MMCEDPQFEHQDLFDFLCKCDRLHYLMAANINSAMKDGAEFIRSDGLVEGHAYSLIQVIMIM